MVSSTNGLHIIESQPLRYLLSVPGGRPPDQGWPVLCFLHGYDEAAPMNIRDALTLHGPLRSGNPALATDEFIVVAPQLPAAGDHWHRYAAEVLRLVREVQAQHGGDPRRTYLSGFSFGGNGVFDLALAQPLTWAALWPVDPTRIPRQDPQAPVWLSLGAAARRSTRGFLQALGLQEVATESMTALAGQERLYLDQGEDHVGSARLAYADERIYRWLLAKQLPGPASSIIEGS